MTDAHDIHTLLNYIGFSPSQMMNVYQSGSRVYGTATPDSDYDFYVIITDEHFKTLDQLYKQRKTQNLTDILPFDGQWTEFKYEDQIDSGEGYKCLYVNDAQLSININLYSKSTFITKLEGNWLQSLMIIYSPPKHIWRSDFKDKISADQVPIYYQRLIVSVVGEAGKHFDMAKRKSFTQVTNSW
jgi:hypothetical protein